MMRSDQRLLDVTETAERFHLKVSTIRRWVSQQRIPYVKLGRRVLFRVGDIEEIIEENLVPVRRGPSDGSR